LLAYLPVLYVAYVGSTETSLNTWDTKPEHLRPCERSNN